MDIGARRAEASERRMERPAMLLLVRTMADLFDAHLGSAARIERSAPPSGRGAGLRDVRTALRRVEALLERLIEQEKGRGAPRIDAATVRALVQVRRFRTLHFGPDLAGHPGWSLLLELYAAMLEGRRHSASTLAATAALPPTSVSRWLGRLARQGLVEREPDPDDERRSFVALSEPAARSLADYLRAAANVPLG